MTAVTTTTSERSQHQDIKEVNTPADTISSSDAGPPTSTDAQTDDSLHSATSKVQLTPRTNLYASDEGWTLIAALPHADQSKTHLETEGATLTLSAPHLVEGVYQRSLNFPKETTWGALTARWDGDLLYLDLKRAAPVKRAIAIS
jgi:HSP20 family molecular chaperone IbpA